MKKAFLLFCYLFFNVSFSQTKDTIYGKVKSVREELHFLDENRRNTKLFSTEGDYGHHGFWSIEFTKHRFYLWWFHTPFVHYVNYFKTFNSNGKPVKETWFYRNGDTVTTYHYSYDSNHNLILSKEVDKYATVTINYEYNNNDKLTSLFRFYSIENKIRWIDRRYQYNRFGDLEYATIRSDNNNERKFLYGFDFYDRKTKKYEKCKTIKNDFEEEELTSVIYISEKYCLREEFFYDDRERIIETRFYKEEGEQQVKLDRVYKKEYQGDLLKKIIIERGRYTTVKEYDYDEKNRKKKEVYSTKRGISTITNYDYNNEGLLVKVEYVEPKENKKSIIGFEYEFDDKGNWIKQIKSLNDEKLYVWTRKIEYY